MSYPSSLLLCIMQHGMQKDVGIFVSGLMLTVHKLGLNFHGLLQGEELVNTFPTLSKRR